MLDHVSAHDLVFLSPVDDPTYGIPIGDGSTGCLIWPEGDKLVFAVNNTDLWDFQDTRQSFRNHANEDEEHSTSLRHAGRLELRFDAPVFDLLYQEDYEARLSLADACVSLHAQTPFSEVSVRAFASHESAVTVVDCEAQFQDAAAPSVLLERWGSRTFAHWYSKVKRDASAGLSGTEATAEDNMIFITQELSGNAFCIAAAVEHGTAERLHGRAGKIAIARGEQCGFRVYLTVADSLEAAKARLRNAMQMGVEAIYEAHKKAWGETWGRAFVSLPDDYLENLWYLNIYYANAQMRGKYPPHFCNGIWGFQRDFVPWNYYFHYNMQLGTWPLLAANQAELLKPYLDFRFRQLPYARRLAMERKGVEGALYTDVASATGACDLGTLNNLTPGAQIAQTFWKYYQFTGDRAFLMEKAWPMIRETALFYANLVKRGEDGCYHIYRSEAYEDSPKLDDSITDHAAMRTIFRIAVDCAKELGEDGDRFAEILAHLAPIKTVELQEDEYYEKDGVQYIADGVGKDKPIHACVAPVTGIYCGEKRDNEWEDMEYWHGVPKGTPIRTMFNSRRLKHYYGFPGPEMSMAVPGEAVGLKDRGSELFEALVNVLRLEKRTKVNEEQLRLNDNDDVTNMGWQVNMVALARLGLAGELLDTMGDAVKTWQWYPNGLGHYGGYLDSISESNLRFHRRVVNSTQPGVKFPFPAWPFRHFDYELLPVLATAVNEMLLQSHENRVRLFSACPAEFSGGFRLAAEGGFLVRARMERGEVLFAEIEAPRGGLVRLVDPWGEGRVYANGGYVETVPDGADRVAEIDTRAGECLLVTKTAENAQEAPDACGERKERNGSYKRYGRARLGVPRMF
ncbi:MAG: hypothetical protein FWF60_01330 [Oscillospiraceae bacterium]|nr:hypothetical protein [Oscillospiraceae bacterium]